jgi:hypothetical protein
MTTDLNTGLSKKTFVFGLKVWVLMGIIVGLFIVIILVLLSFYLTSRKKSRRANDMLPISQIPMVSEEIKEIKVDQVSANKSTDRELEKFSIHPKNGDNSSQSGSFNHAEQEGVGSQSGEEGGMGTLSVYRSSSHPVTAPSPLSGLPEFSHLGWGHWFTLRDLDRATNRFSKENIIGEGGYGIVFRGNLINGTPVAVKKLFNNL